MRSDNISAAILSAGQSNTNAGPSNANNSSSSSSYKPLDGTPSSNNHSHSHASLGGGQSLSSGGGGSLLNYLHSSTFTPSGIASGVMNYTPAELRLRLPADETSFELGVIYESLPEYLYLPAIRTQYASEMGHLIRVLTIWWRVEWALNGGGSERSSREGRGEEEKERETREILEDCGRLLDVCDFSGPWYENAHVVWYSLQDHLPSLPPHLLFTTQSLSIQQSMWETSANLGAWCFAALHVYGASARMAIGVGLVSPLSNRVSCLVSLRRILGY